MRVAELKVPHTCTGEEDPEVIWVICPYPLIVLGLGQILKAEVQIYESVESLTRRTISLTVLYVDEIENLPESFERAQAISMTAPVLVLSMEIDFSLALAALNAGARGFIHAGMAPTQIARALSVASKGEMVAPRELLDFALSKGLLTSTNNSSVENTALTSRQKEILGLVAEGLDNNEIARRLFLSESTVKQHLRSTYKTLGVKNRTEAVRVIRDVN